MSSLGVLQENFITLLAYDDQHAKTIRSLIEPEFYGGPYKLIATRIYEYLDRYKKAPKDHIADLMGDKLDNKVKREADLYEDILLSIRANHQGINAEYVMSQLETFTKRQHLRSIAIDLAKALQRDTDESLAEAETLMRGATVQAQSVFNPGLRLSNKDRVLDFLDISNTCFPTGIPELDKRGFGPTRKELWLYLANTKKGKTWALIQLAKMSMVHRLKVCHVTLEMSEERAAQRYFQSLFGMAKRREKFINTKFQKDKLGRVTGFDEAETTPKLSLDDPKIREKLERRIDKFSGRWLENVYIKQFPTGSLTIGQLEAYLDNLESTENFIPDLLILDYPDLMKIDKNNYRLSIDEVYKDIRGLGIKRNMAVAAVSQTHRAGAKAKVVGSDNVAEAYSKIAHADVIITYSQTEAEQKLGLARLFVAGGRNDQDQITICISQNYGMGSFIVDSVLMSGNYWNNIPKNGRDEEGE